jgi:hypothetical protein
MYSGACTTKDIRENEFAPPPEEWEEGRGRVPFSNLGVNQLCIFTPPDFPVRAEEKGVSCGVMGERRSLGRGAPL